MGVIATGSIFKTLTFDGRSSSEFNVYITGEGVFNAPERAVEMISIPGRNGAFALDNGRFENIEVTYNCGIAGDSDTDFAEAVSAFRNWLCSRKGYVRLTDDYNAGEYRMAVYKSGLEVTAERLIAGEFPIVFECKPQRFLTSGEDKITVGEWGETTTETGDIVEIENPDGILSVKSLTADINAEQDLNGYSSPWIHNDNEQTPYIFRSSDTVAEVGNSIFDKVVGGTLAVNQLLEPLERNSANGITEVFDSESGVITLSGTATGTWVSLKNIDPIPIGHVAICITSIIANPNNLGGKVNMFNGVFGPVSGTASNLTRIGRILQNSRTSYTVGIEGFSPGDVTDGMRLYANVIDLTQFFCGSTIADYVYNLEQSTAGSGVAWLKQYYPSVFNSYQPFNAGTLESVEASEHVMTGKNLLNPKPYNGIGYNIASGSAVNLTEATVEVTQNDDGFSFPIASNWGMYNFKTPPLASGTYRIKIEEQNSNSRVSVYVIKTDGTTRDIAYNMSGIGTLTTTKTLESGEYILVASGLSVAGTQTMIKPQIEIGTTATDYEPYTQTSYPLDSDLVLRGIPKLNNGVPYYDGDEYKSDGSVNRRYGIVDLGTLTWTGSSGLKITTGLNSVIKRPSAGNIVANIITTNYTVSAAAPISANDGKIGVDTSGRLQCGTSDTPTGYLVYELATPTTETADPYTNPQVCYKGGTEEYITNNVVPVGHITDHANICPITGHDTVNVIVSPTTTGGTTYSTALGSTVYGGTLDIVSGELTVTHAMVDMGSLPWIASGDANNLFVASVSGKQNGNTNIMSDMYNVQAVALASMTHGGMRGYSTNNNVYCKNTDYSDAATFKTAMNGVQLVYELATPTTTTLTAQQVELLLGANNIWADTGNVAVEFGQNPNILVNPTLFDSRPMLEVTGSGAVNLGSDTIQINNDPIGDVVIFEQQTKNTASAWPVYIETQYANTGDPIIVTECQYTVNWTLSRGLISDITYTTTGDGHAAVYDVGAGMKPAVWLEDVEFAFGTASTITTTATFTIVTTNYGTLTADITLSLAYDGASQLILSHTATRPTQFSSSNPRKTIYDVILRSSQIALGNPIYIDLNIGEAYKIENDVPVSVNNGVVIPAELPTLTSGANMVTCDDTITQLDIVPRWWKI